MSIELVLGSIGTFMGVLNFIYWAWWARRERVTLVDAEVRLLFVPLDAMDTIINMETVRLENHSLKVSMSCSLALTNGDHEIEVSKLHFELDRLLHSRLMEYFRLPQINEFTLTTIGDSVSLQPRKSVFFRRQYLFECRDEYKNRGADIESLLAKLNWEYKICWTRYDGRQYCWNLPQRWWRNLGKKL
jgi:hypothetical protein